MVTLQMASLVQREAALKVSLLSLYDQVDHIRLMLNGYDAVPEWISSLPKVEAHIRDNALMDGERFYLNETNDKCLILFCDDDLSYPADFVSIMARHYINHGGIVSIMGKNLLPRPIWSYNGQNHEHFKTLNYVSSVYCKNNGIKKIVIPHKPDWVEDLMVTLPPNAFTIWTYNKPLDQDRIITDFINQNL
jgi:hypothetical protein